MKKFSTCFICSIISITNHAFAFAKTSSQNTTFNTSAKILLARGGSGYHSYGGGSRGYSNHYQYSSSGSPTRVRGHQGKNGTYVQPHYRTHPDNSRVNNWSSKGNTNPYTGKQGTKDPYANGK